MHFPLVGGAGYAKAFKDAFQALGSSAEKAKSAFEGFSKALGSSAKKVPLESVIGAAFPCPRCGCMRTGLIVAVGGASTGDLIRCQKCERHFVRLQDNGVQGTTRQYAIGDAYSILNHPFWGDVEPLKPPLTTATGDEFVVRLARQTTGQATNSLPSVGDPVRLGLGGHSAIGQIVGLRATPKVLFVWISATACPPPSKSPIGTAQQKFAIEMLFAQSVAGPPFTLRIEMGQDALVKFLNLWGIPHAVEQVKAAYESKSKNVTVFNSDGVSVQVSGLLTAYINAALYVLPGKPSPSFSAVKTLIDKLSTKFGFVCTVTEH